MSWENPYETLQVHRRACDEVIHAAFRAMMQKHHPDRGGDPKVASQIGEAYRILSDPKERRQFDAAANRLDGTTVGNFKVEAPIAEGGIGKTYKGTHLITGKAVCIKHCTGISPDHDQIMVNETQVMWDLRHYAIPAVRDLIRLGDDSLALVMSYIEGPTLEQIVQKRGKIPPEHVAWMAERILNCLKYLHYNGVIHGDLKPQNIIVQPQDHTLVLVDFGLAMAKPKKDSAASGYTDLFSPPEQIRGGAPLIPETDFYSLGMTLIYALGGGVAPVQRKEVPDKVPAAMCEYIRRMIVRDTLSRPGWHKEDLCETVRNMRQAAFGRTESRFLKLDV